MQQQPCPAGAGERNLNTDEMNRKLILILGLLYAVTANAQDADVRDSALASAAVHRDPRVESLMNIQIRINEVTTRESRRNQSGFRIQVANSKDRNEVFAIKTRVYQQYPELKPYLIYQPPNYKLKIGNFKTKEEAQVYVDKLNTIFPSGVYIVPDIIDVKPE
jgi:hypothetical protein